ncbi:MAG: exo-alpha-sialidase, partial [Bacteroidaceae bacterium]|nr:exo-alpha-sialidase [Bacteroidaceae bacterium]
SNDYGWSTDWKITETEPMYIKEGQLYTIAGYVARNGGTTNYVYYDGTTRSMSTTAPMDFSGVWKAVKSEGMWKFKAAASKGKYLTYDGVNDTGAFYTIEEGVSDGSLSMKIDGVWSASSETGEMGGKYKATSGPVQSNSYDWATDWIFTEYEATATGLSLTTTATALVKKSGWVTGLVGTKNNQWSLPTTAAIVADLGEANTPSTGFYWGMGNGQNLNSNNDLNGLSSTAFNMVARQAYTGTYAAQVYVTDKVIREINVGFSAGGNLTRTSFSIWKLEGSTATCLAQSASSALAEGEQSYSAKDLYLPVGSRLILIWNANNAGQTLNITNFNATYVEAEDIEELDEVTYIVEKASGCLLKDNSTPNQTWNNTWKNYSPAQLIFSCPANNMTWNGNKIDLYTGQTTTSTYTISAPESFTIKSYSFILKNNGHDTAINLTIDGKNYTTSSSAQTFSKSDVNEKAVSFTLSGTNGKGVTIDEFTVTVERDNTPDPLQKFITMPTLSTSAIPYRIPAIGQAYNGDVIAVADYRYSRADIGMATNGKIDLRYRVKDHATGEWGEIMTLAAAEGTDAIGKYATSQEDSLHFAYGDPCIVCDINSSDVVVTSCSGNVSFPNGTRNNHQGWAYFLSHDNGQTWEPVKDISRQIFTQFDKREGSIRCMFIGSGKICQSTTVKVGTHNRLYCAALVKLGDGSNTAWSLYSDDFGHTWNVLGGVQNIPITGADEPKSEELPDGSILLSTRIASGRKYNIYHFTDIATGEGYWETAQTVTNTENGYTASSNACNGETLCVPVTKKADNSKVFLLLQSVPFGPTGRTNVGINYKELTDFNDFRLPSMLKADSWDGKYQVSSIGSAYSTMCLGQNGEIHFLYEEETYCGTGGGGYSIVYKNIPVEIMTNDAYEYRTPTNEDLVAYLQAGFTPYYNTIAITEVGDYVGQITTAGKDVLDNAKDAYIQNPTHANYNVYNATYITTDRVALKTNQHYRIMNRSRGGIRAYSISLGQGKMVGAATDENSLEQHFRVVPVQGTSDQWYLQNATNGEYFGKLGANETESTNVTETADAGIWVINSNINGISTFYNTNKTGSNSYIHLANGNVRLVPWTDSEASQWYILPIDYAAERSDESTDIDIVITGTVSSAAEVAALVEEVSATVDMTNAKINVTVDDDFVEVIKDQTKNPNTILYVTTDATVTSGTSNVVVDGVCDKLVLSDSEDKTVSIPNSFSATSAQYTRGGEENPTMITKTRYATIYMPYAFSTEGLKVMQFKGYADGVLTFEEVGNPEPNVPYLIRQADDSDEESVKIAATGTNTNVATTSTTAGTEAEFLGTYTPLTLYATTDGYDYYGYSSINGDFHRVSATGNPCYPFRAYFRMPHTDEARTNLSVIYDESGEVTGIDNIVETGANAQPIYNLNGTRVNKVEKGSIYIQGGRKIVTK